MAFPTIDKSLALWERSQGLIPGKGSLLAKAPGQWSEGVAPIYAARGEGAHLWDVDGNEYVDLLMACGPVTLGYKDPDVDAAVRAQLERGMNFSLLSPLEVEVSERVRDIVPHAENVRFSKTGADATSAAVRIARAHTGRNKILCCGYHGWHDWYITVTDRNAGIPAAASELTFTFAYNDLSSLEAAISDEFAAVIMEPTIFDAPASGFLEGVRELCDRHGTLLIFDEMWTGFRLSLGGGQEKYGVRADLCTFSKAVANGMPLSIITGSADVMKVLERDVFFYTTFGGEAMSLAACKATLDKMKRTNAVEVANQKGQRLKDGFNAIAEKLDMPWATCVGYPSRAICKLSVPNGVEGVQPLEMKTYLQQELLPLGILWSGFHNVPYALTDADIDQVLAGYEHALPKLREAVHSGDVKRRLKGKTLEGVFRRVGNAPPVRK